MFKLFTYGIFYKFLAAEVQKTDFNFSKLFCYFSKTTKHLKIKRLKTILTLLVLMFRQV